MSTEFRSTTTDELAFVRWAGRKHALAYEFGTMSNWENVLTAMRSGDTFLPTPGCGNFPDDPKTPADLERLVVNDQATFGEFPVIVELGAGELERFTVER